MATCNANYCFTMIDVGAAGCQSDGGSFSESAFGQALADGTLEIPQHRSVFGTTLPFVLVADEAFPLKTYIMRPYPEKQLVGRERIFNYKLSRARNIIENTFGILVARLVVFVTNIYL